MANFQIDVNEKGKIHLPPGMAERYGVVPGASLLTTETGEGIFIHRGQQAPRKIYVEPTNRCNLNCRICVRQNWTDEQGVMEIDTYEALIGSLSKTPTVDTIHFGGYGEPLLHPEIKRMIRMAKEVDRKTELITNGMLLSPSIAENLVDARLDTLIFSLEGLTPGTYEAVRQGASFKEFTEGIRSLSQAKAKKGRRRPQVGLEFIAMRDNIKDLQGMASFAAQVEASFVIINNLLPHTEEMKDQRLYNNWTVTAPPANSYSAKRGLRTKAFPDPIQIRLPKIQLNEESYLPLFKLLRLRSNEGPLFDSGMPRGTYCRFVNEGFLAIGWDGEVSPCLALMHSYGCYVLDRYKEIRRYSIGNIRRMGLQELWEAEDYARFRSRVQAFEFSPCAECGGCDLSEKNEEDCFGNSFPVCGDCLWARGILQCP